MSALEKLHHRIQSCNSLVCVGLDSEVSKLPERFRAMAQPQFEFNKWIIDQTHQYTAAYKPNLAFYEARGEQGLHELKLTLEYLQTHYPDIFTIADAKRADIGSTNEGYVTSIFDWYGFDAITLHPYLGQEALQPFLDRTDKVAIILCRTSNPGAGEFQDLLVDGEPVWKRVALQVSEKWNKNHNCMLVVGATYPEEMKAIRAVAGEMDFLVPGIGAQGGEVAAVMKAGVNKAGTGLLINSSRGVIFAQQPAQAAQQLYKDINQYR